MSKTLQIANETYEKLLTLAEKHNGTIEGIIGQIVTEYENQQYWRSNELMQAQGILVSVPSEQPLDDDFEPEQIQGKPLSKIIIEERLCCQRIGS